jgi:hypothetical protein
LYSKYSSSQNYYYTKDINEILTNERKPNVIDFKDLKFLDEREEYLKRYYKIFEYSHKLKMLAEYYKFHKDIPRLFFLPLTKVNSDINIINSIFIIKYKNISILTIFIIKIINRYHDKKRRIDYIRITKML